MTKIVSSGTLNLAQSNPIQTTHRRVTTYNECEHEFTFAGKIVIIFTDVAYACCISLSLFVAAVLRAMQKVTLSAPFACLRTGTVYV